MTAEALPLVLVVEDDAALRLNVAEHLEAAGLPTLTSDSAPEAIKLLEATPGIAILFTDVEMAGAMDGLALAHYVHHRWPHIAIVVTSGQLRLLPELLPSGARFLSKPYRSVELPRLFQTLAAR
jgi:CheY-like chemotaxis protein